MTEYIEAHEIDVVRTFTTARLYCTCGWTVEVLDVDEIPLIAEHHIEVAVMTGGWG